MAVVKNYYQTPAEFISGSYFEEGSYSYTNLDLFKLKNKLQPFISKEYDLETYIEYDYLNEDSKIYLVVQPMDINGKIELNEIQRRNLESAVFDAISLYPHHTLLYPLANNSNIYSDDGTKIPIWYINSILPYINLEELVSKIFIEETEIGARINSERDSYHEVKRETELSEFEALNIFMYNDGLYINLDVLKDPIVIYDKLVVYISEKIAFLYQKCILININEEFARNWNFVKIQENLFEAKWKNRSIMKSYGNMINFFMSLIANPSDKIKLFVSENDVIRYWLSYSIYNSSLNTDNKYIIYDGPQIKIKIGNLDDLYTIISLIRKAEAEASGQVMIIKTTRLAWCILYKFILSKLGLTDSVYYATNYHDDAWEFSALLNLSQNADFYMEKLMGETDKFYKEMEVNRENIINNLILEGHNKIVLVNLGILDLVEKGLINLI